MAAQDLGRTYENKSEKILICDYCWSKQIKSPISLHTCATIHELPSNISAMVVPDTQYCRIYFYAIQCKLPYIRFPFVSDFLTIQCKLPDIRFPFVSAFFYRQNAADRVYSKLYIFQIISGEGERPDPGCRTRQGITNCIFGALRVKSNPRHRQWKTVCLRSLFDA